MDDALKSAALAACEAQRHEIQAATLQWNVGLLEAAFVAGVEWRDQHLDKEGATAQESGEANAER